MNSYVRRFAWSLLILMPSGLILADEQSKVKKEAEAISPTEADVKYGPGERNVLDFYQALSKQPTPLVIYIHGGGFVGGNKTVAPAVLKLYNDAGISLAAIHYQFVDGQDVIFPIPQHDGGLLKMVSVVFSG